MKSKLSLCIFLVLTGCATSLFEKTLNLQAAKSPFSYRADKASIEQIQIPKDSKAEQNVYKWLSANSKNWKTTYITYAPNKVIRGQNFELNFLNDGVVLNFSPSGNSGDWRQYWKPINEKDSEFLTDLERELNP